MQITASQLFSHLSNSNEIPYSCKFHFSEAPLLWYETERLFLQSSSLHLRNMQIQNPVRVGEKWNDEYYLMYYRELCGGRLDPLDPLYGLEKFELKEESSDAESIVVIHDIQYMERDGHSFKRGHRENRLEQIKLKTVPSKLIHTEQVIEGTRSRVLLADFKILSVLGITVR